MYNAYENYLTILHNRGHYRRLNKTRQERSVFLDFSHNDYLNLSQNKQVIEGGYKASQTYGMGSTGSRLLSGHTPLFDAFETTLARDKNQESSLIFSSGFQANVSTLACLLDSKVLGAPPLVFFDKENHASLYQGVFLSQAKLCRYRHCNMEHLENLLTHYKHDPRQKFIVTETVFGMNGNKAPLDAIVQLAEKFQAFIYLDEAHATGVLGPHGYGLSTTYDIPHVVMGTFSKAMGVSGAYIACHSILRDYIINKATGFIYSTAPSPAVVGSAFEAWLQCKKLDHERNTLQNLGHTLRVHLKNHGFNYGLSETHIVPIFMGDEETCLRAQAELLKRDILVSAIRPPTVPPGTSRLRVCLTIQHTPKDIDHLMAALCDMKHIKP